MFFYITFSDFIFNACDSCQQLRWYGCTTILNMHCFKYFFDSLWLCYLTYFLITNFILLNFVYTFYKLANLSSCIFMFSSEHFIIRFYIFTFLLSITRFHLTGFMRLLIRHNFIFNSTSSLIIFSLIIFITVLIVIKLLLSIFSIQFYVYKSLCVKSYLITLFHYNELDLTFYIQFNIVNL